MSDPVLESRLAADYQAAEQLAEASDILDLHRVDGGHRVFIAELHCNTYVKDRQTGAIVAARGATIGIRFPEDYLREPPHPALLLTVLAPLTIWHPNVRGPAICIGDVAAGEPLTDLLYRLYEVISFQNYCPKEYDALCSEACTWARHNAHLFPADDRPLKRRTRDVDVEALDDDDSTPDTEPGTPPEGP